LLPPLAKAKAKTKGQAKKRGEKERKKRRENHAGVGIQEKQHDRKVDMLAAYFPFVSHHKNSKGSLWRSVV
jgi:hypothetical protein